MWRVYSKSVQSKTELTCTQFRKLKPLIAPRGLLCDPHRNFKSYLFRFSVAVVSRLALTRWRLGLCQLRCEDQKQVLFIFEFPDEVWKFPDEAWKYTSALHVNVLLTWEAGAIPKAI